MTLELPPRKFVATVGPPHIDESLRGYLGRALSVTAVRNIATLLKLADATKPNAVSLATTLTDEGEIHRIATLIGCMPHDIVARTYRTGEFAHSGSESIDFCGTQIRLHFRETRYRRVSPRALEIAQYHRALWELRPLGFDPQTKEKLLGICPVCNRKLGWLRADVPTLCDKCDTDLRDFPQPVSPVDDQEAYGFVVGLVDPDGAKKEAARRLLSEPWRGFSNGDLFETAVALASGLTLDPARTAKSAQGRSKGGEQFQALTPDLLAAAGRAIIGGPDGFAALCERYRADMDLRPIHYGRRKELGALAYIGYDKHIEPNIRTLIGDLVDTDMESTREKYALRRGKDASDATMTIETMAKTFGLRRSSLQRLAESGLVPVIRANDAQSPVRMAVRDVRPLVVQLKDAIGENETAGVLGLPLSVLPSLADRGLLRRLEGPVQGLVPGCSGYHQSSVDELMEKIWAAARPKFGKCCSIMVAARSLGAGESPWAAVITAIIAGDAVVHDTGAQRRNIRFSLAVSETDSFVAGVSRHLQDANGEAKLPDWIAQSTAAEILQVNVAFFSRLANSRPDLLPQRGPGYTPYLASEVQALAGAHVFVPEIARRADMHPRRVVSWLRSEGVRPSLALQENRDFSYARSVVEPLLSGLIDKTERMKASLADAGDGVRVRLVAAVAAGAGTKATADAMGVGYREAKRWVEAWREAGAVAPRKFGFRSKLDDHEDFLRSLVAQRPDIKLTQITEALASRGMHTSDTAVWNALERFSIAIAGRRGRPIAAARNPLRTPTSRERNANEV
jgi:transposase